MLRPATPADTDALVALTAATGVFKPLEIDTLRELLGGFHEGSEGPDHVALTWEDFGGQINGFVYYAPTPMTVGTWHLYWIAVRQECRGLGIGGQMLHAVEQHIRDLGGRLLVIETSTTPPYDPTRRFYLKHGYTLAATIPDFYADDDGMAVFTKKV